MSVIEKKRKRGTTYYVETWWNKAPWRERSGTDKREAERLDARRKREVAAGTFRPTEVIQRATVALYAADWGAARKNISAADDRRNLARFLAVEEFGALHLDDVRPRHIIEALGKLKSTASVKTLQNAYGTLRTMFRDAVIAELVGTNPCVLPRGFFAGEPTAEREPYTRAEAAVLARHHSIPWPIRVLNTLCLLGGFREGEACGLRWSDLDQEAEPLWSLACSRQYGGRALKTRRPRVVPVHPELQEALAAWGETGFVELMGRAATPDDFIVPHASARVRGGHHTRSTYYKAFVSGCKAAGVPCRSLHSTRHTMITLARRGGARKDVLEQVTHNAKGDIVDRYTHMDWQPLCDAVLAIGSLSGARPSPHLPAGFTRKTALLADVSEPRKYAEEHDMTNHEPSSIPGASTNKPREKETRGRVRGSVPDHTSADIGDDEEASFLASVAESSTDYTRAPELGRAVRKTRACIAGKRGAL